MTCVLVNDQRRFGASLPFESLRTQSCISSLQPPTLRYQSSDSSRIIGQKVSSRHIDGFVDLSIPMHVEFRKTGRCFTENMSKFSAANCIISRSVQFPHIGPESYRAVRPYRLLAKSRNVAVDP